MTLESSEEEEVCEEIEQQYEDETKSSSSHFVRAVTPVCKCILNVVLSGNARQPLAKRRNRAEHNSVALENKDQRIKV
ncbi:MAG: hypothetical protein EZS28_010230 [Streblomastix strix]|uniref:Uncharacterized protein n=1 Tax=Streblomastix strix TaxID=222440 RepID=A0A5J4WHS5_9EUKA|nr:MAG: hypothetical protein EZS28_010230 [Streblomastix strix]